MKSIVVFVLLHVFFILYLNGQNTWSFGAKAGPSFSILLVDDNVNTYSYTPGFHFGALAQYQVVRTAIQSEFIVANQNNRVEVGDDELYFKTRYYAVPLILRYKIFKSVYLTGGPQIGFLACVKSNFHPVTREKFEEQDYTKAYKKTDLGLQVGAGWEASNGLLIDLRYYHGLADISDFEGVADTRVRSFQLSAGYRYKIGS